jgi:hypothetical protein
MGLGWLPGKNVMFLSIAATLVNHGQDIVKVVGYLVGQGVALVD